MISIQGLYTIADNTTAPQMTHRRLAEAYLKGGARIVQLRMKSSEKNRVYEAARQIVGLKSQFDFTLIINDYLEVAKEIGADGYHGGKDDPTIEEARRILGREKVIGYSAHSVEEAVEAERRGADHVAFGAIFPSPSKGHDHQVQGLQKLREVVHSVSVPVVAIGGIGRENIKEVLSTGVASVAMISSLLRSGDILNETEFYARLCNEKIRVG